MVKFLEESGGFVVKVDDKILGRINQVYGFYIELTTVSFISINPEDLRTIANKTQEVQTHGWPIPLCQSCKGTPGSPGEVYSPNEGLIGCQAPIHQRILSVRR